VRSRKCACPKAAAFLTRQQLHIVPCYSLGTGAFLASRLGQLRAACKGRRAASSPTRCAVTTSKAVRPAVAAHLEPSAFLWWYADCCALPQRQPRCCSRVCLQRNHAANARAGRAGASRTSASHSPFEPFTVRSRAHPGCGRTAQRPQRRLPSWASRPLILGRCERCLAGSGCFLVCHLLHMQECRHAEGMQRCLCMQLV